MAGSSPCDICIIRFYCCIVYICHALNDLKQDPHVFSVSRVMNPGLASFIPILMVSQGHDAVIPRAFLLSDGEGCTSVSTGFP